MDVEQWNLKIRGYTHTIQWELTKLFLLIWLQSNYIYVFLVNEDVEGEDLTCLTSVSKEL